MKTKILSVALFLMLISCGRKPTKEQEIQEKQIPITMVGGTYPIYIYEIDGHTYITNSSHGGIIHSESCKCKNPK